jgi:hypothetical protein
MWFEKKKIASVENLGTGGSIIINYIEDGKVLTFDLGTYKN